MSFSSGDDDEDAVGNGSEMGELGDEVCGNGVGWIFVRLNENRVKKCLARGKRWVKENEIKYLTESEAEKVVKNRMFSN
ncbi:hypothetical protein HN51_044222 [Arachis hypogaea]